MRLWIARIPWPLFDIVPPRGGAQNRKLPPKFQGLRRTPRRCWNPVSHFRRIQGLWHAVHLGRWLSVLDQSISDGRRLPIYGTGAEGFCSSVREANCVSGRLRRIGDRTGTCPWNPGPACKHMRPDLHVDPASNYPGPRAPFWQYFGAALDHLALALCFAAFAVGIRSFIPILRTGRRGLTK